MKVFYGNSGGNHYIMCSDYNEVYSFDMFGNTLKCGGGVSSCQSWLEVDFVSIVDTSLRSCEILCNGLKASLNKPLFEVARELKDKGNYLGTMYNIKHEDDLGKYNQIIFVYRKGVLPNRYLDIKYPNLSWKTIDE